MENSVILIILGIVILAFQIVILIFLRKIKRQIPDFTLIFPELAGLEAFEEVSSKKSAMPRFDEMLEKEESEKLYDTSDVKREAPPKAKKKAAEETGSVLPQQAPAFPEEEMKIREFPDDDSPTLLENSVNAMYTRARFEVMQQPTPENQVVTTVYAPETAGRFEPFLLAVFAHTKAQTNEADEMAKLFDEEFVKKAVKNLCISAKNGDVLGFGLQIGNWHIAENYKEITWNSSVQSVEYELNVPRNYANAIAIGTVTISHNGVPAGNIKFKLKIGEGRLIGNFAPTQAKMYRKAFISYASENRAEVLKRTQALSAAGLEVFQDVTDLKPGDAWEPELYRQIDLSDVFFLFWSVAAKQSQWVTAEWQYALQKQHTGGAPDIIPIPIEGPPPVAPPEALGHLHFNDRYLYF